MKLAIVIYLAVHFSCLFLGTVATSSPVEEDVASSDRPVFGLIMNSGGLVAAGAGAAIMRGLQQQKIVIDGKERPALEGFDFIAGLSGGNVPTALYAYSVHSSNEVLDADYMIHHPSQITPKALRRKNRKSIMSVLTPSAVAKLIPLLGWGFINKKIASVWPLVLWWICLKPHGIKRNQFFGPSSMKGKNNFVVPRDEVNAVPLIQTMMMGEYDDNARSFTLDFGRIQDEISLVDTSDISNSTLVAEVVAKYNNASYTDFTCSSEECYTGYSLDIRSETDFLTPPEAAIKPWEFGDTKKNRFSLELLLSMGTNLIPFTTLSKANGNKANGVYGGDDNAYLEAAAIGNPFVQKREVQFGNKKKNMLFSDAGTLYTPAVATLVKNGVTKLFIPMWLPNETAFYSDIYRNAEGKSLLHWMKQMVGGWGVGSAYFGVLGGNPWYNHIFDDGMMHMQTVREAYDTLYKADKPLITTIKNVKVLDNPYQGIKGGSTVDITFMYITMPKKFANAVPRKSVPPPKNIIDTVDENGKFTNLEFKNFPNFNTFNHLEEIKDAFHNNATVFKKISVGLGFATLSTRQANMMSYLGSWIINEAWDGVYVNGKEYFGGFDNFFGLN